MIGLVTDSSSQITDDLARRLGAVVVPVVVSVDGVEYHEGVDLDADGFWAMLADRSDPPDVKTSQPNPTAFVAAYEELVARGATEIVSVHVAEEYSGTVNSARLAADVVDVPVHVVDSGTASFGITLCVWEAADAIAAGRPGDEVALHARGLAPQVTTAFIIQALDFARRGGRFTLELPADSDGVMILGGEGSDVDLLGTGHTVDELCDAMVARLLATPGPLRVGVCLADPVTLPFTEGIEERLSRSGRPLDVVRYRVGPSIAAHTGPGTAGGFSCRAPDLR